VKKALGKRVLLKSFSHVLRYSS